MQDEFVKFQHFFIEDELLNLTDFLKEKEIEFQIDDNTPGFDVDFSFHPMKKDFIVKLRKADFPKVKSLLAERAKNMLDEVSADHYLFKFSQEELIDVVRKSDEWSVFDVQLAKKILHDKGVDFKEEEEKVMKEERLHELAEPKHFGGLWLILIYICSLFLGIFTVFLGWFIITYKKTLPNGDRIYFFDESTRKNGWGITIVSMLSLIAFFYFNNVVAWFG